MVIDVFNHFMPAAYLDRLARLAPDHIAVTAFPRLKPLVDVDARLRLLDQFGDLRQVISLANPPLELVATPGAVSGPCARSRMMRWPTSAAAIRIAFRPSSRRCR